MDDATKRDLWGRLYRIVGDTLRDAPGCHDFEHTLRVLKNARLLLKTETVADPFPVEVAALLHDIARPEELASEGRCCHARLGAEKVKTILGDTGCCDPSFILLVSDCVRTHRYRSDEAPASLEARIVYDADKLDSIGAIGIARAFHFAGRIGAAIHNSEADALSSASYSAQDSAYREYLVKLRYLQDKMLTVSGRALAQERAAFMQSFFDRLNSEWMS